MSEEALERAQQVIDAMFLHRDVLKEQRDALAVAVGRLRDCVEQQAHQIAYLSPNEEEARKWGAIADDAIAAVEGASS